MQISPDGQWFWDGAQWRPAYSPDRSWRWDGRQWVPAGPPPAQQWRYEPNAWTRRLQVIVLALTALGIVFGIASLWTVLLPTMQRSIDLSLATQSAGANVDPQQLRSAIEGMIYVTVGFGAVLGAVFTVIIVVGTVKLWRWVYWFLAVSYLIAALAIPQDIAYALGLGGLSPPVWWVLVSILLALFEVALGLWMILLYRRYGTWARRRVPV